jgi:hypothetical protein
VANKLYPKGKQNLLSAGFNLPSDTIRVALVDAGYTYNAAHDAYDDLTPASNVVGTPQALSGKSVTDGVFDAASPVTFTSVTGDQVTQLVIYKDTGVQSTSLLLVHIDSATGLPVTPNGGNITVSWDTGASKIFAL